MSKIILGVAGTALSAEEAAFLKIHESIIGGIILFGRNLSSSPAQVKFLTSQIKEINSEFLICIDEEGGIVSRLTRAGLAPEGFFQPAEHFGKMYAQDPRAALNATKQQYGIIGAMLKYLGIDVDFAPVADLLIPGSSDIIGNRSFGSDPEIVIALCKAAIEGLASHDIIPCLKHAPGHGRAYFDTHEALATVDFSLGELESTDFKVFKDLCQWAEEAGFQSTLAMLAHIKYPALDPDNPITRSKKAIEHLRNNITGKQQLVTDCVTMKGFGQDMERGIKEARDAGIEYVLINSFDLPQLSRICALFQSDVAQRDFDNQQVV